MNAWLGSIQQQLDIWLIAFFFYDAFKVLIELTDVQL